MQKKIQSASANPRLETVHIVQCAMCGLLTRRQIPLWLKSLDDALLT